MLSADAINTTEKGSQRSTIRWDEIEIQATGYLWYDSTFISIFLFEHVSIWLGSCIPDEYDVVKYIHPFEPMAISFDGIWIHEKFSKENYNFL